MGRLKKIILFFVAVILLALFILGYMQKDNLNRYISEEMQQQIGIDTKQSVTEQIHSKYNYLQNGMDYKFTLLEFGSTGCVSCKQMEPVLKEVKNLRQPKVNVVFMHIMKPENLPWMKYYGISAVPMQIFLDEEGREFFRHYGVISATDIKAKLTDHLSMASSL